MQVPVLVLAAELVQQVRPAQELTDPPSLEVQFPVEIDLLAGTVLVQ
jgi:hypothetical protein